jgi:thiosulfate dehydrogenase (quinone) large subunit
MRPMTNPRRGSEQPGTPQHRRQPAKHVRDEQLPAEHSISGYAVLPLRLFLGITFLYAAIQKVGDPGFLHPGSPTYIGTQMLAFSRGSPIQGVLHYLIAYATIVGVLTVLTEGAIGVSVLLGVLTRPAALVGMALSVSFFLSASWQTYPYFFGSDIVFVVCWLTLAITGPGVFALDIIADPTIRRTVEAHWPGRGQGLLFSLFTGFPRPPHAQGVGRDANAAFAAPPSRPLPSRRLLSRGEALIGSGVTLGLIAFGLHPRATSSARAAGPPVGAPPSLSGRIGTPAPGRTAAIPAGAKKVGNVSQLPVNSAGMVTDPKTGDPAIIIHTSGSTFCAFDVVCTHAGCTVQYDPQQRLLVCPCHGGTFDPAHGARVVAGPPPSPLTAIDMTIDPQGDIYIV